MQLETVKVKRDGPKGYHVINKADFREGVHTLYDPDAAAAEKAAADAEKTAKGGKK